MAERTGWSVANFALPDAGFVADGRAGTPSPTRWIARKAAHPRVILIVGGTRRHRTADTGRGHASAPSTRSTRSSVGGQQALVVGPTWYETPVPECGRRACRTSVRKAAEETGVPLPRCPRSAVADQGSDAGRPKRTEDEGQSALADRIAAWLRSGGRTMRPNAMVRHRGDRARRRGLSSALRGIVVLLRWQPRRSRSRLRRHVQDRTATQPAADATRPSALFIGDSYTAGRGSAEMSYACMAAVRMGWLCDLSAWWERDTSAEGLRTDSSYPYLGMSMSFSERIPHLAAKYDPDIVVLDGGRNDELPPREDVFNAMVATIAEATPSVARRRRSSSSGRGFSPNRATTWDSTTHSWRGSESNRRRKG